MQACDPSRQPEAVAAFLATVPPFDRISPDELAVLAAGSRVAFYLENELVCASGEPVPFVGCVQRGGVRLGRPGEAGHGDPGDVRGQGECFGLSPTLAAIPQEGEVRALEDTFLVRLPRDAFAALVRRCPQVAAYFEDALSRTAEAPSPALPGAACPEPDDGDYLFTRLVGEVASRALVSVERGTDLRQAARIMEQGQVGSVLVREVSGAIIGIVTDRDLRRAVAQGLALSASVETLMSTPVAAIEAASPCFEGLIRMTGAGMHHLLVIRENEPVGMVTASDLLLAHGRSPMALLRAVRRAGSLDDVQALCRRIRPLAAALTARGATAVAVGGIVTLLAERVLGRVLALLEKTCGPSPAPCRWLALGAAGRREMLPGTGFSLAVVVDDGGDPIIARAARTYMAALLPLLGGELDRCGLRNAATGLSLGEPRGRFDPASLADGGDPLEQEASLEAFDARPVAVPGRAGQGGQDGHHGPLAQAPPPARAVLESLLVAISSQPAPLGLYQGRLMERDGSFVPRLDVAGRGTRPLVALARLAALCRGIADTGTLARLERLEQGGHLAAEVARAARDAFLFFEGERLHWVLSAGQASGARDAVLVPATISARRRHGYRAAFAALEGLRLAVSGPGWSEAGGA